MSEGVRSLSRQARGDMKEGLDAIPRRQRARLAEQVAYARTHSPFYRELYRDVPQHVEDPALLPVTDKKTLMGAFDDWVTDRPVTRQAVEEFAADPALAGHRFQDRYLVATTTGTSGVRGLFVIDDHSMAVGNAFGSRLRRGFGLRTTLSLLARGGRTAIVTAPGGHFFTVAATERFRLEHPRLARMMRVFSIKQPLPELVAELNRFNPASLVGFLGMLTLPAGEQDAGRLHIDPGVVIPGGETLTTATRDRLAAVFGAEVRAAYAAGERGFLSHGCGHGWYHVNSDWAIAEPVDESFEPVAAGELSHTVLIGNLANRVQPILRYDLGDNVLLRPDPCPYGSPLPALQVRGRAAEVLTLGTRDGGTVDVSPMALFGTVLERVPAVEQFQLVQTTPTSLRVRLRPKEGADVDGAWQTVRQVIAGLLADHRADGVTLEPADEPPQQSHGGKFRRVIAMG